MFKKNILGSLSFSFFFSLILFYQIVSAEWIVFESIDKIASWANGSVLVTGKARFHSSSDALSDTGKQILAKVQGIAPSLAYPGSNTNFDVPVTVVLQTPTDTITVDDRRQLDNCLKTAMFAFSITEPNLKKKKMFAYNLNAENLVKSVAVVPEKGGKNQGDYSGGIIFNIERTNCMMCVGGGCDNYSYASFQ